MECCNFQKPVNDVPSLVSIKSLFCLSYCKTLKVSFHGVCCAYSPAKLQQLHNTSLSLDVRESDHAQIMLK
jgi:hypothetical protein